MIPQVMYTTSHQSLRNQYSGWLKFRVGRDIDSDHNWVFTDGSSGGSYGVVIVEWTEKGKMEVHQRSGYHTPSGTRNIGLELHGLILGLQSVSNDKPVVIVHDYLGLGAWTIGAWACRNLEVKKMIGRARAIILERKLQPTFIHHAGHQKDMSDFTRYNNLADCICKIRNEKEKAEQIQVDRFNVFSISARE